MNRTSSHLSDRVRAAFEGCYDARRTAALAGVPISTVYYWSRTDVLGPSISSTRPKRWSYADLLGLRIVYWLRHPDQWQGDDTHAPALISPLPGTEPQARAAATPMPQVRKALREIEDLGLDLWSTSEVGHKSPIRVDRQGQIFIVTMNRMEDLRRAGILSETLDVLGVFESSYVKGPDLRTPRPNLRIVPGKVSGEPHVVGSRVTTQAIAALHNRGYTVDKISNLYPDLRPMGIIEAIDLEQQLAAA